MKKHWKKIILVLGILFLSVAGYLVYIFQFKEYETADENVDKVVEEEYEVELPDGSVIILDKDGNIVEDPEAKEGEVTDTTGEAAERTAAADGSASSEGGTSADGSASSEGGASADGSSAGSTEGTDAATASGDGTSSGSASTSSGTAGSSSNGSSSDGATGSNGSTGSSGSAAGGSGTKAGSGSSGSGSSGSGSTGGGSGETDAGGVTVASIKQKYEPTLADIEGQASSRISGLIGAAQSEYAAKKSNGENINYAYFYNKYVAAANDLEARTDTVFYAVIGSLKSELKSNGLAESHAESFVSEYEARKEARKKDLISKASGL